MTVLLTEDSGSGFQFWNKVNEYMFNNTLAVYHTGCGNPQKGAGNNNFYNAIRFLYDNNKINKKTKLVFIYDSLKGISDSMVTESRTLNRQLDKCYKQLEDWGIRHYSLEKYICWEQLILSFRHLINFLPLKEITPQIKRYIHNNRVFTDSVPNVKYLAQYFRISAKNSKYKSVEQGMADLLDHLTYTSTIGETKTFLINKGTFAECWWDNCINIQQKHPGLHKELCIHCSINSSSKRHMLSVGKSRFMLVVRNSQIRSVCSVIKGIQRCP